jgi:hypothetical protein
MCQGKIAPDAAFREGLRYITNDPSRQSRVRHTTTTARRN